MVESMISCESIKRSPDRVTKKVHNLLASASISPILHKLDRTFAGGLMLCCPFDLSIQLYNHHHRLSQNLPNFLSLSSYTKNPQSKRSAGFLL
jgi:hypothetical protein